MRKGTILQSLKHTGDSCISGTWDFFVTDEAVELLQQNQTISGENLEDFHPMPIKGRAFLTYDLELEEDAQFIDEGNNVRVTIGEELMNHLLQEKYCEIPFTDDRPHIGITSKSYELSKRTLDVIESTEFHVDKEDQVKRELYEHLSEEEREKLISDSMFWNVSLAGE